MFVCSTSDIDEAPPAPVVEKPLTLRGELLGIWGMVNICKHLGFRKLRTNDCLFYYGLTNYSRKRKTPVDVPKAIADWKAVIVTLATAHDKEAIDAAEFKMDELLTPLLTAPVADLRAFHSGLTEALRADKQVPFFIWSVFNAWGKGVLEKCEAKPELQRLRKKLANEIAEMVDDEVRPDISKAIAGALMWRDPDTLKAIKSDIEAGARPRLQGRESCLFLTTKRPGRGQPEHKVML